MRSEAGEKSIQLKVRPAGVASNNTMATFVAPTAAAEAESEQSNAESSIQAGEKEREIKKERERESKNVRSRKLHYCVACSQFGQLM